MFRGVAGGGTWVIKNGGRLAYKYLNIGGRFSVPQTGGT